MTESLPRDDARTHVITHALRRFGRRIVLVAVLAGAVVGAYAYLGPHTYKATATVLIRPLTGNALSTQTSASSQSSTVAMETEASLVTSIAVTDRVNDALDTDLQASDGHVTSAVPPNSQIVQITYSSDNARASQRRAQAYAQAFLDYRSDLADQSIKSQLDRLNARADTVNQQLKQALKDRAGKTPSDDADTRVRLFTSNYASLQSEIGQVRSSPTEPGNVVTPASLPKTPTGISPFLLTVGGAFAGLVLALAVAIWRERTDDRIRAAGEVSVYGLPVLAVLPALETKTGSDATDRTSLLARTEALRRTRTNMLAVSPVDSIVAVGGLTAHEPALETAADLARALVSAGYRVNLVDAADAAQTRPDWFPTGTGLSDLLGEKLPTELPLHTVDGLQVLTAGTDPGSASEMYGGPHTRALLGRLRGNADYVIVAIEPADTAGATSLLLAADEVVFIATDGTSTHEQVAAATADARRLGAVVLGLVVRSGVGHRKATSDETRPKDKSAESADRPTDPEKPRESKNTSSGNSGSNGSTGSDSSGGSGKSSTDKRSGDRRWPAGKDPALSGRGGSRQGGNNSRGRSEQGTRSRADRDA